MLVRLGSQIDAASLQIATAEARGVAELHQQWIAGTDRLAEEAHATGARQPSRQWLANVLGDVHTRIDLLSDRFVELAWTDRAASAARPPDQWTATMRARTVWLAQNW